ncbi:helix-turn-helix transcriptional regulator [Saccharothrix obliqua]|uniref:helix-turn-helix transcriptional regulator n=1 Tax=Saccharothrix obliqua TaxID=2861747 RepID=UPI001C5F46CA|nr:helix-turn-helix transcriptional regulator [Saccharothrix obliqua]MBW4722293.1 helix-turn-helix domain-containing protein [Saccharothrix obliqua]
MERPTTAYGMSAAERAELVAQAARGRRPPAATTATRPGPGARWCACPRRAATGRRCCGRSTWPPVRALAAAETVRMYAPRGVPGVLLDRFTEKRATSLVVTGQALGRVPGRHRHQLSGGGPTGSGEVRVLPDGTTAELPPAEFVVDGLWVVVDLGYHELLVTSASEVARYQAVYERLAGLPARAGREELRWLLADARHTARLGTRQVASRAGVTGTAVVEFESGGRVPPVAVVARMARAYGLPPDEHDALIALAGRVERENTGRRHPRDAAPDRGTPLADRRDGDTGAQRLRDARTVLVYAARGVPDAALDRIRACRATTVVITEQTLTRVPDDQRTLLAAWGRDQPGALHVVPSTAQVPLPPAEFAVAPGGTGVRRYVVPGGTARSGAWPKCADSVRVRRRRQWWARPTDTQEATRAHQSAPDPPTDTTSPAGRPTDPYRRFPMTRRPTATATRYETQNSHNCDTWHSHGSPGMECSHGHVIPRSDIPAARQRASRVPDDAPVPPTDRARREGAGNAPHGRTPCSVPPAARPTPPHPGRAMTDLIPVAVTLLIAAPIAAYAALHQPAARPTGYLPRPGTSSADTPDATPPPAPGKPSEPDGGQGHHR